jgi:hypothetical protein
MAFERNQSKDGNVTVQSSRVRVRTRTRPSTVSPISLPNVDCHLSTPETDLPNFPKRAIA